jgi:hypothetical protein
MAFPALLDTCVLYPAYLCDTPLRLAEANDPKDRHVLAAAVRANAEVIVTFNIRDFPEPALKPYDIYPGPTVDVLERQAASYRREPTTIAGLLPLLERTGLAQFAAEVRRHVR